MIGFSLRRAPSQRNFSLIRSFARQGLQPGVAQWFARSFHHAPRFQASRDIDHYAEVFRFGRPGEFVAEPRFAITRMHHLLAVHGIT